MNSITIELSSTVQKPSPVKSDAELTLATAIQSVFRGHQACETFQRRKLINSIKIVDARHSDLSCAAVHNSIHRIASCYADKHTHKYVKEEYFKNEPDTDLYAAETILLARLGKEIVGCAITQITADEWRSTGCSADSAYLVYLSVAPNFQKKGIETKLMIEMIKRACGKGKSYLILNDVTTNTPNQFETKWAFYKSLTPVFGIPNKEYTIYTSPELRWFRIEYDLKRIDFNRFPT